MTLKQRIDADLKKAMLAGDKTLVTTLRGLKSTILYAEVGTGKREVGLGDEEIVALFQKEAKKRQESADLYLQGGNQEKADAELEERSVIEAYLPAQLSDEELSVLVDKVIAQEGGTSPQLMGKIIAGVKGLSNGQADGGRIAAVVKSRLEQ